MVVTGAGSGIGRAVAQLVATAGARVALVGRRADALKATADLVAPAHRDNMFVCPGNVGDLADVDRVADATLAEFGHVDGLVNNAGIARFAAIENARHEDLDAMFCVHVSGPVRLIQRYLPSLREHRGSIVNVTSVGGALATPRRSFYGATKAAINHLTRSLAIELAPEVRVNAVLPGPVDTSIYDDLGIDGSATERLRTDLAAMTPLGRFGTPEEVARWVCLLLGDTGAWVTGVLLPVDGGRCA